MSTTKQITQKKQPIGNKVATMLMLSEEERANLNQISETEMRSVSATGRMILIMGMEQYAANTAKANQS